MDETKTWTITATVTMRGATMEVEAATEEEARRVAELRPDFDLSTAEMSDWKVTRAALA